MATSWLDLVFWSTPHSLSQVTAGYGARNLIPDTRGFYAFVEGKTTPAPDRCLYIGIAMGRLGLRSRLSGYLRGSVDAKTAEKMRHRGKRLISFARIKGLSGRGSAKRNTSENDAFLHLCWAEAPLHLAGRAIEERAQAYRLERALIDFYRPLYNTADWGRDMEFDLEDDPGWPAP